MVAIIIDTSFMDDIQCPKCKGKDCDLRDIEVRATFEPPRQLGKVGCLSCRHVWVTGWQVMDVDGSSHSS
jgi:hypothetical protein